VWLSWGPDHGKAFTASEEAWFPCHTARVRRCPPRSSPTWPAAIASNEPFSGWTKTFTDPRLCAAIVDRLTFAGQIIETGTTSYRLAHARKRRAAG
jgi:hypothetical protein